MRKTEHYNLNLVEGSDIVNPLVQDVPNYEAIDENMYDISTTGICTAREVASGSIHGIIRDNSDVPMFRFTATSNYKAGDTITVDGVDVTAVLSTGEALGDNTYSIGCNVLCCLVGNILTVFGDKGGAASQVELDKVIANLKNFTVITYNSLNAIGATLESTLTDVFSLMKNFSLAVVHLDNMTETPFSNTLASKLASELIIVRGNADRGFAIQVLTSSGNTYMNNFYGGDFKRWKKFLFENEFENTRIVSNLATTDITGDNMLTIPISDEIWDKINTYHGLVFEFGTGSQSIGGTGQIHALCPFVVSSWNCGGILPWGVIGRWQTDSATKTLYIWADAKFATPLRSIALIKNI